jgi:DNA-binding NarL/FixJ family response regulator
MPKPPRIKILIAHGDPLISAGLASLLQNRSDFEAVVCDPALTVSLATASHLPSADVVVADYDSGLRVIESAGAGRHRVMILTHSDSEAKICHALEQGARGYLLLGCSLREVIDGLRSIHVGGTALGPLVVSRIADWMKQQALTGREKDILRQMMLGLSNKGIARNLTLAVGTVKTHVKSILYKLEAASRTEAAAIAQRRGILREEFEFSPPEVRALRIGKRSEAGASRGGTQQSRLSRRSVISDITISGTAP